jgi:hypothetical protein
LKGTTQKVLGGKELRKELFNPERDENKDTDDLVAKMAVAAATAVLKELHDTDKHTPPNHRLVSRRCEIA